MNTRFGIFAVAVVSSAAVVIAGCGSSGGSQAASAPTSASASAGGSASACVTSAQALLSTATQSPPFNLAPAVDAKSLRNKTVWFISVDNSYPLLVNNETGFKAAGAALGWTVRVVDAQGELSNAAQGISEAVAARASAIVIDGIATESIQTALKAAQSAHIPVVSAYEPSVVPGQLAAVVDANNGLAGNWMGAEALSQTHCKGTLLYVGDNIYTASNQAYQGAAQYVAKVCPDCKVKFLEVPTATAGTNEVPAVENAMRANSSIDALLVSSGEFVLYAVSAVRDLGKTTPVVGNGGDPTNIQQIASGDTLQVSDIGNGSEELTGWELADQVVRALLGKPASPYDAIPEILITKANAGESDLLPTYDGYAAKYEANWGLS
jgi:ribose transport system substrate-binding protein